ncbi:hypothetical protein ACFPYI_02730 [Halomarina salina]|uniref:Flagellin n=1 Tax=Halomarina salina TaxID=1872699 RepID=A0ABD5RI61_9EURY|nr:hypothetical protein [Halomarina salina]
MREDRGLSTVISYVLTLGVTGILITGLLVAGGDIVGGQRQATIDSQMQVVGQQIVSDFETADQLSRDGTPSTIVLSRSYPDRMTGATYMVHLEDVSGTTKQRLVLTTENPDVSVSVTFDTYRDISISGGGAIRGGELSITFDGTELVVDDA